VPIDPHKCPYCWVVYANSASVDMCVAKHLELCWATDVKPKPTTSIQEAKPK
jgi:hypothetical protein